MNTQRKKISDLYGEIDNFIENAVTYEEMEGYIKKFADSFAELNKQFSAKMAENKGEMGANITKLRTEFALIKKSLDEQIAKNDISSRESLRTSITSFSEQVKSLRALIPEETDLSGIVASIDAFDEKINALKALFTGEKVRDLLESLRGDERFDAFAVRVEVERGKYRSLEDVIRELLAELKKIKRYGAGGSMGGGGVVGGVTPRHKAFAVGSSTTDVTLPTGVAAQGTAIWVRYQGQMLDYGVDYSVSGNKITFIDITFVDSTEVSVTYWS